MGDVRQRFALFPVCFFDTHIHREHDTGLYWPASILLLTAASAHSFLHIETTDTTLTAPRLCQRHLASETGG